MLTASFCQIRGISLKTERMLWNAGIHSWDTLPAATSKILPAGKLRILEVGIEQSQKALAVNDLHFFSRSLPGSERWRLIPHLKKTAFLDIETTGLQESDHITTIALASDREVKTYVQHKNLSAFTEDIHSFDAIISFNGSCFDLPFLRRSLRLDFPQLHLDLRFIFAPLGIRGGLKTIEQRYRLDRAELAGLDGFAAVQLWHKYSTENRPAALETLLAYNVEDVLSLAQLLPLAFNEYRNRLPFPEISPALPRPIPLSNPHTSDPDIVSEILGYSHQSSP